MTMAAATAKVMGKGERAVRRKAAIGEMVEVDDDVEEAQRLDRARVLIKTPW